VEREEVRGEAALRSSQPVRRGLVARADEWRWSSFRHYALGEVGVVEIESQWTARKRSGLGFFPTVKLREPQKSPAQAELERAALGIGDAS